MKDEDNNNNKIKLVDFKKSEKDDPAQQEYREKLLDMASRFHSDVESGSITEFVINCVRDGQIYTYSYYIDPLSMIGALETSKYAMINMHMDEV